MDKQQEQPTIIVKNYGCGSGCLALIIILIVLVFIGPNVNFFAFPLGFVAGLFGTGSRQEKITYIEEPNDLQNRTPGKVERNMGTIPSEKGSIGQSDEMLKLLDQIPGKTNYRLTYTNGLDIIFFGADFEKNIIYRLREKQDGEVYKEQWNGFILYRLKSAAKGGSLNDTPNGKLPGTYQHAKKIKASHERPSNQRWPVVCFLPQRVQP